MLNKEIDDISNSIKEIAEDNEDAKLLMSIPGYHFTLGCLYSVNRRHKQVSRFRAFGFVRRPSSINPFFRK